MASAILQTQQTLSAPHLQEVSPSIIFEKLYVEDIGVDLIPNQEALFSRIVADIKRPGKATIFSINIHGANMSHRYPRFKRLMQQADTMICDGMGILLASKILPGKVFPQRFAAGDFMPDLLRRLSKERLTVYFLGGEPGVAEQAVKKLAEQVPEHTIVGCHHGYILQDKQVEQDVIKTINNLEPDILFVGFGMPLQEYWIEDHLKELKVQAVFPMGATLDYLSKKVTRAPKWLGDLGLEWAFRLILEPKRMFKRYILGNPSFLSRILIQSIRERLPLGIMRPSFNS